MKKCLLVGLLVGLSVCWLAGAAAFAQTADELYDNAVNKYFLGENEAAIGLLRQALEADPSNAKAKALLTEIQEETAPAAPPTTAPAVTEPVPAPVSEQRVKINMAHSYFIQGEQFYNAADYPKAKEFFSRVQDLLPGHAGANRYLTDISTRIAAAVVPAPEPQPAAPPAAPQPQVNVRIIAFSVSLALALAITLVLAGKLINYWWRAAHVYCAECGTRNTKGAEFCRKCGSRLKLPEMTEDQKGWLAKFGWVKNPFTLNIIPDVFTGHQTEISIILEKLQSLSGHVLVIGGLGTGKSTLLQWLEKNLKNKFETIYVLRPPVRPDDLIDLVSSTISKKTNSTHKYSIYDFQELCKNHKRNILLLLDEAHEFKEEFEQFLRTLGDLPNIYLVMAGLPQAREKLKCDLPALFDRIVESILLGALTREETKDLIMRRIVNAGGRGLGPFTAQAIDKVYDLSYGIPRGILKICDWVVAQSLRANKTYIDADDIVAYSEEIKLAKLHDFEKPKEEKINNA